MKVINEVYTFDRLKEEYSKYIKNTDDQKLIENAYIFARDRHEGQMRKSGDPYITHCIAVGYILASLGAGPKTICAGLLHDTIEDTDTTKEEIATKFGDDVANLVEALTKVTRLSDYKNVEFTAENHRKIFVAMAKDVRAIIIKLADRLHNMRTLQFQPSEKQKRIAKETLEVYAPIAHRLGIFSVQTELEDLSLYYLETEKYLAIEKHIETLYSDAQSSLDSLKNQLISILTPTHIPFKISDRVKSVYSIYKKMYQKHYNFDQIYDIMALRIITESEQNCYEILGYVHATFKPVPGRFKDYIAMPKANLYQSLHTTIVTDSGNFFEIQIRTEKMDELAESGVAAHWRYKEGSSYDPKKEQVEIENQLHWFKDFVFTSDEEEGQNKSAKEYIDALSHDIFEANVYVFTPKGNVICLPSGSTPIDFAYRIHSDIGDHLSGARVNSLLVPITTALKTGDIVEVITSKNASPNSEWLNIAKTNFARNKIRKYLVKSNADYSKIEEVKKGRNYLSEYIKEKKLNTDINKLLSKRVLDQFKCSTLDDIFSLLANRTISPSQIVEASNVQVTPISEESLTKKINSSKIKKNVLNTVVLENGDPVLTTLASCCMPLKGDEIIGFVTTGQGVKVHRTNCPNIKKLQDTSRLINVKWNENAVSREYIVDLAIQANDREGLLMDLLNTLKNANAKLYNVNAKYHPSNNTTTILVSIACRDLESLNHYSNIIMQVKSIFQIDRVIH